MASKQQLIKEVAVELGWTQADIERALSEYGNVSTKEEVFACCVRYAGPALKRFNYQVGALKKASDKQKGIIAELVEKLTNVEYFYQSELVPTLKATIKEQANYIKDLLKQFPLISGK
jgi:hypothetical protein